MSTGKIFSEFNAEEKRDMLAKDARCSKEKFRKYYTYRTLGSEIGKINSGKFWDCELLKQQERNTNNYIEKHRLDIISKEIIKISGYKETKLLDVGIGNALIENKIYEHKNIKLSGIDISDYAIKKANSSFNGVFVLGQINKIPFSDRYFDIVVASEVLEHIPPSLTFQALSEIFRVLKPGGNLLISIPINENLKELIINKGINPNKHAREYTKNIIKMELKLGGFKIYKINELYAFSNNYWIKSCFIKFIRLFTISLFSGLGVNNLVVFARKK